MSAESLERFPFECPANPPAIFVSTCARVTDGPSIGVILAGNIEPVVSRLSTEAAMVYNFSHYATGRVRLVRFAILSDCLLAAVAADPSIRDGVIAYRPDVIDPANCTDVTMRVESARKLADTLGTLGGDAAICERDLVNRLEGMVAELRTARAFADGYRAEFRFARALARINRRTRAA